MPAWVTPPTFIVGEDMTASLMNDITSNMANFLFQSLLMDEVNGVTTGVGSSYTGLRGKTGSIVGGVLSSGVMTVYYTANFPSALYGVFLSPIGSGGPCAQYSMITVAANGFQAGFWEAGTVTRPSAASFYWFALGA